MHTCQPWYLRRHYDDAYDIVYDDAYDTVYDEKPGIRDGTGRDGSFVPTSAFEMVCFAYDCLCARRNNEYDFGKNINRYVR